jgi:hypothetical protein
MYRDLVCCQFGLCAAAEAGIDLANRRAKLLGVVEVPGDRKLYLPPLAAARFGGPTAWHGLLGVVSLWRA